MNFKPFLATATAAAALAAAPAHAVLISDLGTLIGPVEVVDFESFDGLAPSTAVDVGPGVAFTGDSGAVLGADSRVLYDNGTWTVVGNAERSGRFAAGGVAGELRFSFVGGPSRSAGAFVNHSAFDLLVSQYGAEPLAIEVSAYGNNHQIIETHSVVIDTDALGYDEGRFLGIVRPTADMRAIAFKANGVVLDNFSFTTPVPEPESLALMLSGFGVVAWLVHRRRPVDSR